jgi:hypothetical protein
MTVCTFQNATFKLVVHRSLVGFVSMPSRFLHGFPDASFHTTLSTRWALHRERMDKLASALFGRQVMIWFTATRLQKCVKSKMDSLHQVFDRVCRLSFELARDDRQLVPSSSGSA